MMKDVKGIANDFCLSNLDRKSDLIVCDGPLLSLYQHRNGDYYLFYWVDCDRHYNRWILMRVGEIDVLRYLNREVSLRTLLANPADNFVRTIDMDGAGVPRYPMIMVSSQDLPVDYLPDEDSFYSYGEIESVDDGISTTTVSVSIPNGDRGFFSSLVSKMRWKLSTESLLKMVGKTAAL